MTQPSTVDHLELPTPSTPVALAAEMYARLGLPPVPVYGIDSSGACQCRLGAECHARGKHPQGEAWQKRASLDIDEVRDAFRGHRGNIGLYLGLTDHVVLDADGDVGVTTLLDWSVPETLAARSGSGTGAHLLFRLAPHHDPAAITDRRVAPGLDVKIRGQFVVAPSRHTSGGVYEWTNPRPIATLPDWLYDRIRRTPVAAPPPREAPSGVVPIHDAGRLFDRARAYLEKIPGAVSGSGGHQQTFAAARALRGWVERGLPESDAWGLLVAYNARCEPPWSERELQHKWAEARSRATHVPAIVDRPPPRLSAIAGGRAASTVRAPAASDADGAPPPGPPGSPPPPPGGEPDWRSELLWSTGKNGKDKLDTHAENVIRILQLAPEWRGRVRFDEFRSRVVLSDPPWDDYQRPSRDVGYWTDEDATRLHAWLRRRFHRYAFSPSVSDCERSIAVVARAHGFNPVRDYLDGVAWDGTPRLDTWLATYLGAEADRYTELVGAWWLISAVARIYDPGCKVDSVPILEGDQGIRKSSALKLLAGPEFFSDTPIDIGHKDAYSGIQGCWFVELAELESLMKAGPTKAKAFFSSSKDRFRRAYARHEQDELRQCIFVGTVNHDEYLSDPTGERRYHPIRCTRIDIDALARDRDQLWAEAVHRYRAGAKWYPESADDVALLKTQQDPRSTSDAWEEQILAYVEKFKADSVTTRDLLESALGLAPKDWTPANQTRLGIVMLRRLKWTKRRVSVGGSRPWVFERPGTLGFVGENEGGES